ncbi:MAG: DUF3795 domain-containing protein [Lentisphaerota bacterium]
MLKKLLPRSWMRLFICTKTWGHRWRQCLDGFVDVVLNNKGVRIMLMSYCGLDCEKCEAFIATQKNDDALRGKVAGEWAKLYNAPILPEHIHCTGCRGNGVKFYYCEQLCAIRKCASGKGLEHCAACADFACETLKPVFGFAPDARKNLEALRVR